MFWYETYIVRTATEEDIAPFSNQQNFRIEYYVWICVMEKFWDSFQLSCPSKVNMEYANSDKG